MEKNTTNFKCVSIYLCWLCWVFIANSGFSPVVAHRLLTVVTLLDAEHRLQMPELQPLQPGLSGCSTWAQQLQPGLSSCSIRAQQLQPGLSSCSTRAQHLQQPGSGVAAPGL